MDDTFPELEIVITAIKRLKAEFDFDIYGDAALQLVLDLYKHNHPANTINAVADMETF